MEIVAEIMNTSRPRRMGLSHFWRQQAAFFESGKRGWKGRGRGVRGERSADGSIYEVWV